MLIFPAATSESAGQTEEQRGGARAGKGGASLPGGADGHPAGQGMSSLLLWRQDSFVLALSRRAGVRTSLCGQVSFHPAARSLFCFSVAAQHPYGGCGGTQRRAAPPGQHSRSLDQTRHCKCFSHSQYHQSGLETSQLNRLTWVVRPTEKFVC